MSDADAAKIAERVEIWLIASGWLPFEGFQLHPEWREELRRAIAQEDDAPPPGPPR